MKESEKCKNKPSLASMRQMVLEISISHSKSQEFEQEGSRHVITCHVYGD